MSSISSSYTEPRLIIHGGAGAISRFNLPPAAYEAYRASLLTYLRQTSRLLSKGASALDAATYAVSLLEDDPLFNSGHGAVFTRTGTIELEASVMVSRGYRKRGVGVMLVKRVKNPIKLAREVLIRGEEDDIAEGGQTHCQLSGETVEELARGWGLEMCEEKYFWTRRRWEEHKRGLEREKKPGSGRAHQNQGSDCLDADGIPEWAEIAPDGKENEPGWDGREYLPQGTVGAVCLDRNGTLCVATSTGGLTNKLPGRIGDTPTLGAGFWAEEWNLTVKATQISRAIPSLSSITHYLPDRVLGALGQCFPPLAGYSQTMDIGPDEKALTTRPVHAVAMSGTGNGDTFLRLNAVRTCAAIARFAISRSLQSAVTQVIGPGGDMQQSVGDRWHVTGEGEGGIIGIDRVGLHARIVADFNCGGMFRVWIDDEGKENMMVFRDEY